MLALILGTISFDLMVVASSLAHELNRYIVLQETKFYNVTRKFDIEGHHPINTMNNEIFVKFIHIDWINELKISLK